MWTYRQFLRQIRTRPIRRPLRPLTFGEEVAETVGAIRDAVSSGDAGATAAETAELATGPVGTAGGMIADVADASEDLAAPGDTAGFVAEQTARAADRGGAAATRLADRSSGVLSRAARGTGTGLTGTARVIRGVETSIVGGARRVMGGPFVAVGMMLLEGAYENLQYADQIQWYTCEVLGFADTIARIAANADQIPDGMYPQLPDPVVTRGMRNRLMGIEFSIRAFTHGYWKVAGLIRDCDNVRPPNRYVSTGYFQRLRTDYGPAYEEIRHGVLYRVIGVDPVFGL